MLPVEHSSRMMGRGLLPLCFIAAMMQVSDVRAGMPAKEPDRPNVVLIVLDTLRADHLSAYGYSRETSPNIDALLARGTRFENARTVEPLTAPAMTSMLTSVHPHVHGTTRNGIPVREGLPSLSTILSSHGYTTAAFVGNWTLREAQSGLGEHFDHYEEVLTRNRWYIIKGEATAEDLTVRSLAWLDRHRAASDDPVFMWVHYVEPHSPYRLQRSHAARLGVPTGGGANDSDRYDTEIAFADEWIGVLLDGIERRLPPERTVIVFTSDHGESLGEHGYKGHGKHLYEEELRIPLGIVWPGRVPVASHRAPALIFDITPTLLGMLDLPVLDVFQGYDWSSVMLEGVSEPINRVTHYQTHRGAVQHVENAERARRKGLRELAILSGSRKSILNLKAGRLLLFSISGGTEVQLDLVKASRPLPDLMQQWKQTVESGLIAADVVPAPELDEEAIQQLRALGYIN